VYSGLVVVCHGGFERATEGTPSPLEQVSANSGSWPKFGSRDLLHWVTNNSKLHFKFVILS